LSNEITEKELEVKRLEGKRSQLCSPTNLSHQFCGIDIADRAESLSQAALEEKKQSRTSATSAV
jgi:hypothetical protein